jgi:dolichol-phosphate mannosyltransferase
VTDVSLVIPAYNERENVPKLLAACREALGAEAGSHEIVFIDDGSTDGTGDLVEELAGDLGDVRLIRHAPGRSAGCHPSELEGLRAARGDVALFLPADLQILPSVLPAFLAAAASGADIVASRRVSRADPRWRRVLSSANNRIERLLLGVDVRDAHSSMLLTRRAIDELTPLVRSQSALIPAELLARGVARGLRVTEIDIPHFPREAGRQTGARLFEIVAVQLDMLRLRRQIRSGG